MEPFDKDELQDRELDSMLPQWQAPEAPARLRQAVFGEPRPWWRRVWTTSIRVPLPLAGALAAVIVAAVLFWPRPAPRTVTIVKTVREQVPVVQERVVTKVVYRDREAPLPVWQPVAELRPRVIRTREEEPK